MKVEKVVIRKIVPIEALLTAAEIAQIYDCTNGTRTMTITANKKKGLQKLPVWLKPAGPFRLLLKFIAKNDCAS